MKENFKTRDKSEEIYDGYEIGIVKDVEDGKAVIELKEHEACEHCAASSICQSGEGEYREVKLKNTIKAKKGDRVMLESSDWSHIKLTFMQYGLPLLGFLIGVLLSSELVDTFPFSMPREVGVFLSGTAVVGLTSIITYLWSARKRDEKFSILRIKSLLDKKKKYQS